jgi:carboxylesterase type B
VRGFHGNPAAVTLWGQSSGSVAVCTLNVSPRAKGLFQNVIMQSGPCTGTMWGVQGADAGAAVADAMMTHFQSSTIDDLRKLKAQGLWWDEMNNSTIAYFLEKSTAFVDHWLMSDLPIVGYAFPTASLCPTAR